MGNLSTNRTAVPPSELIGRWMTHRRTAADAARQAAVVAAAGTPPLAPSGEDAARVVLAALAEQRQEEMEKKATRTPAPSGTGSVGTGPSEVTGPASGVSPTAAATPRTSPVPTTPAPSPTLPQTVTTRSVPVTRPVPVPPPGLVVFSPRRGARRVLTLLVVPVAVALAVAAYVAWDTRTPTAYAVAGGLAVALVLVWSARGRATGHEVTIEDGILRIAHGPSQHRFPLTTSYPPIEVLGEPGDRGWKVLIQRKGMAPYVVTSKMVDPAEFTETIRRFRPNA